MAACKAGCLRGAGTWQVTQARLKHQETRWDPEAGRSLVSRIGAQVSKKSSKGILRL